MSHRRRAAVAAALLLAGIALSVIWQPSQVWLGTLAGDSFCNGYPARYWGNQLTGEPGNRADARSKLEQAGEQAILVWRQLLRTHADPEVRWTAAEELGKQGAVAHSASAELLRALDDPDSHVRAVAAKAIPQVETPASKAVPALSRMLDSEHAGLAARAMSVYRGEARPALERLIALLRDTSRPPEARWNAARTLGKMGPDGLGALPVLIEFTTDADDLIREHAAEAIGDFGPAAAAGIPALLECLDDPITKVRRDAVRSLGQLGEAAHDAVSRIQPLLDDPEEIVRVAARKALKAIDPIQNWDELDRPADAEQETRRHAGPSA